MTKLKVNEKGQVILSLPVAGTQVILRTPKGKDLKALELASKQPDATSVGTMMTLASLLSVSPELSVDDIEELDSEDVAALGLALGSFRAFAKSA